MGSDFFWRRFQSLAGIWLVLFLIEHLLTNSQSALFLGDDGNGFIHSVNFIHDLPYLPVIELLFLAVPFLIHGIWGIKYAWEGKLNSVKRGDDNPYLPYPRNRAFTWQRITAWLLLVGVVLHVVNMRVLHYPEEENGVYTVRLIDDPGLSTLSERLGVTLYSENSLKELKLMAEFSNKPLKGLMGQPLEKGEVLASASNFGTASLLTVRNTFKQPLMVILYSLFVIAACYHAFNGLWTSFITWGINVKAETQKKFLVVTWSLMGLVTFLGLASVWLTYYNLRS